MGMARRQGRAPRRGRLALLVMAVVAVGVPLLPGSATAALDPAVAGRQEVLTCLAPYRFIHGSLLPSGRALLTAGSAADPKATDPAKWMSSTTVPGSCEYHDIRLPYDAFCGIQNRLPDGNVLSSGGNLAYPNGTQGYAGEANSSVFDWRTETWGGLLRMPGEFGGRWYPTGTRLQDGDVYMVAGLDQRAVHSKIIVRYDSSTETWSQYPYTREWPLYPKNFFLGGDSIFYSGSRFGYSPKTPRLVRVDTGIETPVPGLRSIALRDDSAAVVLFPAQQKRVLVMGGGNRSSKTVTNLVDRVDLRATQPTFRPAASMPTAAGQIVATNLPDGTLYAAGGTRVLSRQPVQWAGIYHPSSDTWTQAAAPTVPRGYHTFALLNDEGDVVVYSTNNQEVRFDRRVEVFHPPYQFRSSRPVLTDLPSEVVRGGTTVATVTAARTIKRVVLDHPNVITHTADVDQRMIDVPFTRTGDRLELRIPSIDGIVLPGWHRIWVVDRAGAVSRAVWTHVT